MASELLDPTRSEAAANPATARPGLWRWLVEFAEARCQRSRLICDEHSWPVRIVLLVYEFLSSLGLAVTLILAAAFTQAAATFVEAAFGTPAAQFGIYQSWWYMCLLGLLAVNIFCAAAIRYPWKRYQTGFVITHIGLLTLLGGTAISRWYGVDAQTQIFEGGTGQIAQEDAMKIMLFNEPDRAGEAASPAKKREPLASFSFEPGPFNWGDYGEQFALLKASEQAELERLQADKTRLQEIDPQKAAELESPNSVLLRSFPSRLCRYISGGLFANARPRPLLYDRDGVRIEVIEYHADSSLVLIPSVAVRLSMPSQKVQDEEGRLVDGPKRWTDPIRLGINPVSTRQALFPHGLGESMPMGGGKLSFWRSGSPQQTAAFLNSAPQLPLSLLGNVVLHAGGKRFEFTVEDLLSRRRIPLEGTEFELEFGNASAAEEDRKTPNPYVSMKIHARTEPPGDMILLADQSYRSAHDYAHEVYGEYWFDHGELTAQERMAGLGGARFDILQGDDLKLYYRNWNGQKVLAAGALPAQGNEQNAVDAFTMPIGTLQLYVSEHLASRGYDGAAEPIPFQLSKPFGRKRPAAKLRMTVDGQSEEFWLAAHFGLDPERIPTSLYERRVVQGKGRKVWISMPLKSESIGFRIRLKDFERKLDPGTSQAAHFASTVDFLDLNRDRKLRGWDLASGRAIDLDLPQVNNPTAIALAPKHDLLYVFDRPAGGILRCDLASRKSELFLSTAALGPNAQPGHLAIDAANEYLYWSDLGGGAIGRVKLADKEVTPRVVSGIRPLGLVLDSKSQKVYWLDQRAKSIGRANFDGSQFEPRAITGIEQPAGLAINEAAGVLYWSDAVDGAVRSAKSDGSERQLVFSVELNQAAGNLVLDVGGGKLYWLDTQSHALREHDLRATGAAPQPPRLLAADLNNPTGLARDAGGGRLLWTEEAVLRRDVWITMNAPVEYSNPTTGRSYRLFQEQFAGPFRPGDADFEQNVSADSRQDELYLSILTVNYDPGRGIWQVGCLLIIVGITVMFYMRAYFFMPGYRAEEHETPATS